MYVFCEVVLFSLLLGCHDDITSRLEEVMVKDSECSFELIMLRQGTSELYWHILVNLRLDS